LDDKKPYYLRQPWDILFKEAKINRISPWSVDLVYLLASLLEEMKKAGIDFRIAGTAVNSSVLIYLKKAQNLLEIEEKLEEEEEEKEVYLPPPVPLPFRFEFTNTSLVDLIGALEKALDEESTKRIRPRLPILPDPIPDFWDFEKYLLEIESDADKMLLDLRSRFPDKRSLSFSEIILGFSWREIIKVFMMLLFLAQRQKIDIIQNENEDIFIDILVEENNEGK
jgi:chromatin segregation and condensation protein Rec8/ScpA/Scc1 (kleisin family)